MAEENVVVRVEILAPALGESMDIMLKKSLAHDGLARGLHGGADVLENIEAEVTDVYDCFGYRSEDASQLFDELTERDKKFNTSSSLRISYILWSMTLVCELFQMLIFLCLPRGLYGLG